MAPFIPVLVRPRHFKPFHNFQSFPHVEGERFESIVDEDFFLMSHLVLSDHLQIRKRLMQERRDVVDLLQDLGVVTNFQELHELIEDVFNVVHLPSIAGD